MTNIEIKRRRFFNMIEHERDRQNELHPRGMYDGAYTSRTLALTVLTEEVGELAEAIIEKDRERQTEELLHVAAVCFRIFEEVM